MTKPSTTTDLTQYLFQSLKSELEQVGPDMRLPTENALSSKYGVSRTKLRAALAVLEEKKLIYRIQGKGAFATLGKNQDSLLQKPPLRFGLLVRRQMSGFSSMNTFFTDIANGVLQSSMNSDGQTVHAYYNDENDLRNKSYHMLNDHFIDGLLLVSITNQEFLMKLSMNKKPIVLIDHFSEAGNLDTVRLDSAKGSQVAVNHLAQLGHRQIAYLSNEQADSNPLRLQGYLDAMAANEIQFKPDLLIKGAPTYQGGSTAALELLKRPKKELPTAILAHSESMALGAMHVFLKYGLKIPNDISVVSTGGLEPIFTSGFPELTAIRYNCAELGSKAIDLLLARRENPSKNIESIMLPPDLFLGSTTTAI